MVATRDQATRWAAYAGLYRMRSWGYLELQGPPDRFVVDAGVPYFETDDNADAPIRHRLAEIKPGLFLADTGRRSTCGDRSPPGGTFASFASRAAPPNGSGCSSGQPRSPPPRGWSTAALVASATALLILGNVALLAWVPGLVDTGFAGALDLSPAEQLAVHLPLALAVLGSSMLVLAPSGWIGRWWSRAVTLQYAALAGVAIALVPLLAAWHSLGHELRFRGVGSLHVATGCHRLHPLGSMPP
jgi:hypothetical protein